MRLKSQIKEEVISKVNSSLQWFEYYEGLEVLDEKEECESFPDYLQFKQDLLRFQSLLEKDSISKKERSEIIDFCEKSEIKESADLGYSVLRCF